MCGCECVSECRFVNFRLTFERNWRRHLCILFASLWHQTSVGCLARGKGVRWQLAGSPGHQRRHRTLCNQIYYTCGCDVSLKWPANARKVCAYLSSTYAQRCARPTAARFSTVFIYEMRNLYVKLACRQERSRAQLQ